MHLFSLKINYFNFIYTYMCVSEHGSVIWVYMLSVQKILLTLLHLQFQAALSCLTWVIRTWLRPQSTHHHISSPLTHKLLHFVFILLVFRYSPLQCLSVPAEWQIRCFSSPPCFLYDLLGKIFIFYNYIGSLVKKILV